MKSVLEFLDMVRSSHGRELDRRRETLSEEGSCDDFPLPDAQLRRMLIRGAYDLQVLMDVVFNHTAEGNEMGPTISFRGLDNQVYYMIAPKVLLTPVKLFLL